MNVRRPRLALRKWAIAGAAALLGFAAPAAARAQTVNIAVDGSNPGAPIERIWAFHGYDEANYTTLPEGKALLQTLGAIHTTRPTSACTFSSTPATARRR